MSKQQDHEHMEDAAGEVDEGIKIAVPEFVVDKDNPFAGDLLDREPRVRLLCDFASSVSDHAVIAVDGGWGTGKTAFLRMCRAYLQQQEVRVAEFNAWTESYTADPVFNLASALAELVDSTNRGKFLEVARAVGLAAVREVPFGEIVAAGVEAIEDDEGFPNGLSEYRECVRRFREELTREADRGSGPLVVLVDELDRCLPEQVVAYLRAVHNLLAVPGVVVVMAINSEQTANGLTAVYGTGFDAGRYLQRFFHLGVSLEGAVDTDGLLPLIRQLRSHFGDDVQPSESADYFDYLLSIPAMSSGGALRDLQRVGQALQLTAATGFGQKSGMNVRDQEGLTQRLLVALALLVLRQLDHKLYREFVEGKKGAAEVMVDLHDRPPENEVRLSFAARAVTAYLDVLGDALGKPAITESQYQEIASRYGHSGSPGGYRGYCEFRESVHWHLHAATSRQVLAAVEMTDDWPNRYLRT